MVVVRYIYQAATRLGEMGTLLQELFRPLPAAKAPHAARVYRAMTGSTDWRFAVEVEFESLADWQEWVKQVYAYVPNADKRQRLTELMAGGASVEAWELIDLG